MTSSIPAIATTLKGAPNTSSKHMSTTALLRYLNPCCAIKTFRHPLCCGPTLDEISIRQTSEKLLPLRGLTVSLAIALTLIVDAD